ncbi:ribonuclease HII [Virgibacillus sp. LDC-1]|uniref:ribonuclease HII n=1 Tax=Virgibacillus sp. LDC-1 TaxID=3039856 RepID=UPI0024DE9085|nr:ribonuclease HII [Virgibacillus sp. LDC-1]
MSATITEIKTILASGEVKDTLLQELKNDNRKGVQALLKRYEAKQQHVLLLEKQFQTMCHFENEGRKNGYMYIAGMDEAGRGPLAGPVVAAAVILPPHFKLLGLNDSKQLNEAQRNEFFHIIKDQAISYSIAVQDNSIIDDINIFEATKRAMRLALDELHIAPDYVLIDAVNLDRLPWPSKAMTKGDQKSISIAAASILAKVTRDTLMQEIHEQYPMYQFNRNMGYGTKAHLEALKTYGITPYHRKSFAPVKGANQ